MRTAPTTRLTGHSRRAFLQGVGLALGALALPWHPLPIRREFVSLHMDRPYVSVDSPALPYQPRGIVGGARSLATLSEPELRMRHPYL
jgi:hypothetical protein